MNDKTTIPLFIVLGSTPLLIGAIMWLASVDAKATRAADSVELIQEIHIKVIKMDKDIEYLKEVKSGKDKRFN